MSTVMKRPRGVKYTIWLGSNRVLTRKNLIKLIDYVERWVNDGWQPTPFKRKIQQNKG